MALLDRAIVRMLPVVPRPVVRKLSERYIAGPELADACRVIKRENAAGSHATVDVLGESVDDEVEARAFVEAYLRVLRAIEREGLDSNVSIKPTAFGLGLGYEVCRANLEEVIADAASRGNFVRIEMEDSSCTDETLALYRELRGAGHENIGVVLQAYLRRTPADIRALADLRPNVRLVKGIYVEPPSLAYRGFDEIRASFVACLEALLTAGAYVGVATHDEWLVDEACRLLVNRPREEYEFQMLLGVRRELGARIAADGHRLRIYVPFGERWYEYSLRRLQENPKIAGYIAADTFGRLLHPLNGRGRKA
ncbi:MAG: proline dehydrogenase family protein [Actinobacteria bacterium]|nr:proline dehydrogenase family protein [Actinomycetota bacterium]